MTDVHLLLRVSQLRHRFDSQQLATEILKGIDFELRSGETLAITGKSGSGKSTLLSLLGARDDIQEGSIWFKGQSLQQFSPGRRQEYWHREVGFVDQHPQLVSSLTAWENVFFPLSFSRDLNQQKALSAAREMLQKVGLEARLHHYPHQLSGGEAQRVSLARALVINPSLLLADEPSANLDEQTGQEVMQLLFNLVTEQGKALVLVTHDLSLAQQCQRRLDLREGRLC